MLLSKENRDRFDGKGIKYEDAGIGTLRVNKVPYSLNIPIGGNTPPKMNFIEYSVKWDKNTIQYENTRCLFKGIVYLLIPLTSISLNAGELPKLKVSQNGRFIVTEKGEPFFCLGIQRGRFFII